MLDKLVDLLVRFGMDMLPFVIVEQWNGSVQLRFGKFIKVLYPGIHFKIPFLIRLSKHLLLLSQSIYHHKH